MEGEPEEEEFEEEPEEEEQEEEESNVESKIINPPYVTRVPEHRLGYNGTTPHWAEHMETWSRHQH